MSVNNQRQAPPGAANLLVINLLLAFALPHLISIFGIHILNGPTGYALAFLTTFLVLSAASRRYATASVWTLIYVIYLTWELILSNIHVAWLVLQPKPDIDPGIVAMPLQVRTDMEITAVAWAISLTPGTLCLELLRPEDKQPILYVHSLQVKDPDQMRASVYNNLEAMVLRISGRVAT